MPKKPSDSTLERYRAEWLESRKRRTLQKALAHCRDHHLHEFPVWLKKAIYEFFGLAEGRGLKKIGRKHDLMFDSELYETVEDYLRGGYTQEQAWEKTAIDHDAELKARSTKKPMDRYLWFTVKKAWLRHQDRIAFDHVPLSWGEDSYRIKDQYRKNDRNWKEWMDDVPRYLKPENNPPSTPAEMEDAARALKSAIHSRNKKHRRL